MSVPVCHELRKAWALAALAITCSAVPVQAPSSEPAASVALVEQPRPFGYFIGDIVTQSVRLEAESNDFVPADLARDVRISAWFERRAARLETRDGERWLVVRYQIVNAPETLATVTLPAWELKSRDGTAALSIPAASIDVAALAAHEAFAEGGLQDLRPDQAAPLIATVPLRTQLGLWSGAFLAVVAVWLAWLGWRNLRATARQPFARALHELRRLDETTPEAWATLHRAFDATARRAVHLESLPVLFERAPHLQPLRPAIETFFRQSAERFFGTGAVDEPVSVRALCGDLRRAEKRRER